MKLLALDCSAVSASVSVWDGERMLGEWFLHIPQTHSQTLMPMVRDLLEMAGIPLADMEVFAVSVGPGSFTGVRIGVSCVKGMALPGNTPCVGVSTLEAMAHPLAGLPGTVCAVMDARCAQVYHARFSIGEGVRREGEEEALPIALLPQRYADVEGPIYLVGDGAVLCAQTAFAEDPRVRLVAEPLRFQRSSGVALAALQAIRRGEMQDAGSLAPVYLRLPQAERELKKRLGQTEGEKTG